MRTENNTILDLIPKGISSFASNLPMLFFKEHESAKAKSPLVQVAENPIQNDHCIQYSQPGSSKKDIVLNLAMQTRQKHNDILFSIFQEMEDAVWSFGWPSYNTLFLSPSAEKLFGVKYDNLILNEKYWESCIIEEDRAVLGVLYQQLERKGCFDVEYRIKDEFQNMKWIRHRGKVVNDSNDNPVRFDCIFTDISEEKLKSLKLSELAATDALTGLKNRRCFSQELLRELDKCNRYSQETSIAILDLDHFKKINDEFGHVAGDSVLKEVAAILSSLRKSDLSARLGGEEFVVLMPHTPIEKAKIMAERIRNEIENRQVKLKNGKVIRFTVSIGLTTIFQDDSSIEEILQRADRALYESKGSGRNKITVYP